MLCNAYSLLSTFFLLKFINFLGHVHSWGGIKNLLTDCESTSQSEEMFQDLKGPVNPTLQSNYEFLKDFFKEVQITRFLFYKNTLYKNVHDENGQKIKNIVRILPS